MANGFTLKQQRFIEEYLGPCKGNATKAAEAAGYATPHPEGCRLLQNATVRARIDELLMAQSLSSAEVLAELTDVARADWRDFVQVRYGREGEILDAKILLSDKVKALELLGKYHQLFTDKVQHSGTVTFADLLSAAVPSPGPDDPPEGG